MRTGNKIALAAGSVVVAAVVAWALRPQPVTVEVAQASRGAFEQAVSEDGKTRVMERYVIAAPLGGRIDRIALKAGDPVREGQVVAVLTPSVPGFLDARTERELRERVGAAQAQRLRARAEVQKAEAQLAKARLDLARAAKLAAQGFVAPAAREDAELALRNAQKAFEAATYAEHAAGHEAEQAKAALERYEAEGQGRVPRDARWQVRAPVSGAVLKVDQESEGPVALGAPLVEIADPRSLEAVVDALSQEAVAIRAGMPARLDVGGGLPPLAARVRRVEPEAFTKISALGVEEQRVNVVLDFAEPLDRVQTIGDGFRVEAHIVTFRAPDALKVPVGALFRDGPGWAVFVVEDGRALKRAVTSTRRNGLDAMIDAGLKAGDTVVVYPTDSLADGARVRVLPGPPGKRA
ncbi:MAG TPA: efflux RND transporter periplasmic adaptor subunit [Burkholderiales bacterium]|nr:efflux RND transporter periplasmic adaptor subunit [Burkholderiales bacterium]